MIYTELSEFLSTDLGMNTAGLVISYLGIFFVIGVATVLQKLAGLHADYARKIVHIGVSNWWIIAMVFFSSMVWAAIGPVSFILINAFSYRYRVFKAMEHPEQRKNLGTIYFPVSLLVMVMLTYSGVISQYAGAAGILILGYGDGLAAVAGKALPLGRFSLFGSTKTISGVITMWIISFIVTILVFTASGIGANSAAGLVLTALITASVAAGTEVLTPFGIDNLTVPLTVSFTYALCTSFGGIV